jgi:hypothetical protein
MKKLTLSVFTVALLATQMFSCKKDEVKPDASDNAEEYARIGYNLSTADESVQDAQEAGSNQRISTCFDVSWSVNTGSQAEVPGFGTNYRKFTLNFTGGNCDSLLRTGQIIVYQTGSYIMKNYKDSIVYNGYSTNGESLNGYKVLSFSAANDLSTVTGNYAINIKATSNSGKTVHLVKNGQRTISNYLSAIYRTSSTTGSGQLITSNGIVKIEITKPVVHKASCWWKSRFPVEGTITYTNTITKNSSTLDFGDGSCNRLATITVNNGTPKNFVME